MDQNKDPNFDVEAFKVFLKAEKKRAGLTGEKLALKSGGEISSQTLNLYITGYRYPNAPERWLPLMRLFQINKAKVLEIDKREKTAKWLEDISEEDTKQYPSDEWKSKPVTREDLEFLMQVSGGLKTPLTRAILLDLLERR